MNPEAYNLTRHHRASHFLRYWWPGETSARAGGVLLGTRSRVLTIHGARMVSCLLCPRRSARAVVDDRRWFCCCSPMRGRQPITGGASAMVALALATVSHPPIVTVRPHVCCQPARRRSWHADHNRSATGGACERVLEAAADVRGVRLRRSAAWRGERRRRQQRNGAATARQGSAGAGARKPPPLLLPRTATQPTRPQRMIARRTPPCTEDAAALAGGGKGDGGAAGRWARAARG